MNTNTTIEDNFLTAFLEMSCSIRGNRLLKNLSFNEMVVCNILLRARQEETEICAAQICEKLNLFKSQAARILASLEKKGLIRRIQSQEDKRRQIIVFQEENLETYSLEHETILQILNRVHEELGTEQLTALTELLRRATAAAIKEADS